MTGTLLILGGIALIAGVVVGALVRLWLGPRSAPGHVPDLDPDLGLLVAVAVRPSRREAERTARWLSAEDVRTTVTHASDGWRVLVFADQADDARVRLGAG